MKKLRNPAPLGCVRGPGLHPAQVNLPELEEVQFVEISFQLITDSHAVVGYADMNYLSGEGVLHHLFGLGDRYDIRLESGSRELILGDFGIYLDSENDFAVVTARW